MRIYVDFDDVICETARPLAELALQQYGCRVSYADIRAFDLRVSFGLDETRYVNLMRKAHEPDYLISLEATPGAVETLSEWMEAGHAVEIVTGRPCSANAISRAWLARFGLARIPLVHVDKYNRQLGPEISDWAGALTVEEFAVRHYDLAVEDAPVALEQLAAMPLGRVVIFDRPWNRDVPVPAARFTRCTDWPSVARVAAQHAATVEGDTPRGRVGAVD